MIKVEHLSFAYEENKKVLNDISFNIPQGQYVALMGHNGSGKSTLAKLLAGLLENKTGIIKIDDAVLNATSIRDIRKKLGIVFQNPDNQFIGSTVADDLAFGLENRSWHESFPSSRTDLTLGRAKATCCDCRCTCNGTQSSVVG